MCVSARHMEVFLCACEVALKRISAQARRQVPRALQVYTLLPSLSRSNQNQHMGIGLILCPSLCAKSFMGISFSKYFDNLHLYSHSS